MVAPNVRRQSAVAYWLISLHIGKPLPQNKHGHLLGHVKDHGGCAAKSSDRLCLYSVKGSATTC